MNDEVKQCISKMFNLLNSGGFYMTCRFAIFFNKIFELDSIMDCWSVIYLNNQILILLFCAPQRQCY